MLEKLANIQHDIWAHWMKYMFSVCVQSQNDEGVIIPEDKVIRWKKQINTIYNDLSESEKESDRQVIKEFLGFLLDE